MEKLIPGDKHVFGGETEHPIALVPRKGFLYADLPPPYEVIDQFLGELGRVPLPGKLKAAKSIHTFGRRYTNGGGSYRDHGHHELNTQEVDSPFDFMVSRMRMLNLANYQESQINPTSSIFGGYKVIMMSRGIAVDGTTPGTHLSYCVAAEADHDVHVDSQALLLAGMVGMTVLAASGFLDVDPETNVGKFSIFQKSAEIVQYTHHSTTSDKPFISVRDEPLADPTRFSRRHLVGNDLVHSPWLNWLRAGFFEILIAAQEVCPELCSQIVGSLPKTGTRGGLAGPLQEISHDTTLTQTVETIDGQHFSALDLLEKVYELVCTARDEGKLSVDGINSERQIILEEMGRAIDLLRTDRGKLKGLVDWILRESIFEENNYGPSTHRLDLALDIAKPEGALKEKFQGRLVAESYAQIGKLYGMDPADIAGQANDLEAICGNLRPTEFVRRMEEHFDEISWTDWHRMALSRGDEAPEFIFFPDPRKPESKRRLRFYE